jgi:hypothetical protein
MSDALPPAQRLALSRARLASALSEPLWQMLLQRCLQAQARAQTANDPTPPTDRPQKSPSS